jgi:hypothetical protein
MANITAVKSGNWSDPTVWSSGALPTAADDVFANAFNVTIDQNVTVLSIRQSSPVSGTVGGTFILNNGITVNATSGGFISRNNSFTQGFIRFTLALPNSATLVGNINHAQGDQVYTVDHTGTGTLNIIGNLFGFGQSGSWNVRTTSTGTLNITGSLFSGFSNNATRQLLIQGNTTVNITGDIIWRASSFGAGQSIVLIQAAATLNVVGTVYGGADYGIQSTGASLINIIGPIIGGVVVAGTLGSPALNTTNGSSVTILTGPFISNESGIQPFIVVRMHYRRTLGSYYEFRNNSTNGALPPSAPAPATRLVSPDTVADSPIPANVRQGTVYSLGSQTGTMIVPSPSNVANNVPVDNTVGTAVLDPNAIWAVPLTSINTLNSIGRRVKNAATVETTGAQIQTTLNNNE